MFELTALGLVQHLSSYPGAHVFVSAPLTETSHKLLLLTTAEALALAAAAAAATGTELKQRWSLKRVHFLAQEPILATDAHRAFLLADGSPNGFQVHLSWDPCVTLSPRSLHHTLLLACERVLYSDRNFVQLKAGLKPSDSHFNHPVLQCALAPLCRVCYSTSSWWARVLNPDSSAGAAAGVQIRLGGTHKAGQLLGGPCTSAG